MLFQKSKRELPDISDDIIVAPAGGEMFDIRKVADPMFAGKTMGDGVAFQFSGNKVDICAPANGELSMIFPTGHAFGITMNSGVEILVHIGIETVEAKGKGFKIHKKCGSDVKAGEPIVTVKFDDLKKKYDMSTMLIITNTAEKNIVFSPNGTIPCLGKMADILEKESEN